jgi:ABC-type transporter Mla subunit MlaD
MAASVQQLEKEFQDSAAAAAAALEKRGKTAEIKDHKPEVVKELRSLQEALQQLVDTTPRTLTREAADEFIKRLANMRSEDLATIVGYLDKVTRKITDFLEQWNGELEKQAELRQKELEALDLVNKVMKYYV